MNENKNFVQEYVYDDYENIMKKNDEKLILSNKKDVLLTFGVGEDENIIVGNEKGLNNLIEACTEALKDDKSLNIDLSDLSYGIKKVDENYFKDEIESNSSLIVNFFILIISFLLIVSVAIGFGTIIKWIFT